MDRAEGQSEMANLKHHLDLTPSPNFFCWATEQSKCRGRHSGGAAVGVTLQLVFLPYPQHGKP